MIITRRITLILRAAILPAAVTGLFWTVWWLVTGNMPSTFGISHGYDALFVGATTAIAATLFTSNIPDNVKEFFGILVGCVGAFGAVIGSVAIVIFPIQAATGHWNTAMQTLFVITFFQFFGYITVLILGSGTLIAKLFLATPLGRVCRSFYTAAIN